MLWLRIICSLLVSYGAVSAIDHEHQPDGVLSNYIRTVHAVAQSNIQLHKQAVNKGIKLVNSTVQDVLSMVNNAADTGVSTANNVIDSARQFGDGVIDLSRNNVRKTLGFMKKIPFFGRMMPTGLIENVADIGFNISKQAFRISDDISKTGTQMVGNVAKGVTHMIGRTTGSVNNALVAGENLAASLSSNAVRGGFSLLSNSVNNYRSGDAERN